VTDRDAPDRQAADTRAAWTIGGVLLLVSPVLSLGFPPIGAQIPGSTYFVSACFAVATILFAFGIRGSGSVTARRPVGTTALVFLGVWGLLIAVLFQPILSALFASSRGGNEWTLAVSYLNLAIQFAAALIAAIQIVRAGVVPRPWNWAPIWVLVATALPWAILQLVGLIGGPLIMFAFAFSMIDGIINIAAAAFLGVVAIVLGQRSVHVTGPASEDSEGGSRPRRNASALLLLSVGAALMALGVVVGLAASAAADRALQAASGPRTLPVLTYTQYTQAGATLSDFTWLWVGALIALAGLVVLMAGVVAATKPRPASDAKV